MGLLDLRTDLKSLRFGKDRLGGGSSNQPYIQRDLPDSLSEVGRTGGPDFLLRGGTLVPRRIGNDVSRLTQMFFDFKSPSGPLFIAKQNLLALSGTDQSAGFEKFSLASGGSGIGDFLRNNLNFTQDKIYTPLSTLGQAAGGPIGLHLFKQGLNPLTGPQKYTDILGTLYQSEPGKSRVLSLFNNKLLTNDRDLFEYKGGPGSINGIGRTIIPRFEYSVDSLKYSLLTVNALSTRDNHGTILRNDIAQELRHEQRIRLGNPGRKDNIGEALDKLNAMPIYNGEYQNGNGNDFVKFRIGVINNDNPSKKTFIHFRALIDDIQENYTSEWDSLKYMGRGEKFYRYQGFDRQVNLSWTIAAQSKQELIPMYQKLNFLASSMAPYYSEAGYMGGNLVSLTLGGWFYEQPGIITSMNLSVPQESPWEIAIPDSPNSLGANGEASDPDVKELPHIIKVSNVTFIPIHTFRPQLQKNSYKGADAGNGANYANAYGPERYFALSNGEPDGEGGGGNNNYGNPISGEKINNAENYIPSKITKKTPTVEVGQGAFGGAFDQGDFVDIDSLS